MDTVRAIDLTINLLERKGWCAQFLKKWTGEHCLMGAYNEAVLCTHGADWDDEDGFSLAGPVSEEYREFVHALGFNRIIDAVVWNNKQADAEAVLSRLRTARDHLLATPLSEFDQPAEKLPV